MNSPAIPIFNAPRRTELLAIKLPMEHPKSRVLGF
jgi:hypothetical protein